jgi:hypothetical protein
MQRPTQEILDQAEELAQRFEDYDHRPTTNLTSRCTSCAALHSPERVVNSRSPKPSTRLGPRRPVMEADRRGTRGIGARGQKALRNSQKTCLMCLRAKFPN